MKELKHQKELWDKTIKIIVNKFKEIIYKTLKRIKFNYKWYKTSYNNWMKVVKLKKY